MEADLLAEVPATIEAVSFDIHPTHCETRSKLAECDQRRRSWTSQTFRLAGNRPLRRPPLFSKKVPREGIPPYPRRPNSSQHCITVHHIMRPHGRKVKFLKVANWRRGRVIWLRFRFGSGVGQWDKNQLRAC